MSPADVARLLTLAALWGGSFVFMRVAVGRAGPLWLAASRSRARISCPLRIRARARERASTAHRWRDYLVIGVINTALPFALFSFAAQHVAASTAAILNATSPFFATIIAALWLKDRVTPAKIVGMMLGISGRGTAGRLAARTDGRRKARRGRRVPRGAPCATAIASVYAKARLTGLPSFAVALYSQMTAMIVLVAGVALRAVRRAAITPLVAANVIALAVASTAVAYLLYFRLIATIGPARALTVTFLIPLFGVLWGFLFLDEKIGANTLRARVH